MKKPNFFVLGAPKCGTSSLAKWLSAHPHIYVSPTKEPHWFNKDHGYQRPESIEEYEALYSGVEDKHLAVGEASATYLYSKVAVDEIVNYNPHARFIVMLRNPVEMAPSLHGQLCLSGDEDILDFGEAWRAQAERVRGERVPKWCLEPRFLLYGAACSLGEQVERLYARVSRDRVYVLLLEDLKKDPRQAYIDVLAFLGVSDDGRVDFEAHNVAKRMASRIIFRGVRVMGRVKRVLGVRRGLGVLKALNQFNMRVQPWARLSPAMTGELTAYFRDDVEKLAALIERDLSHWSRPKSASGKEPGNFRMGAGLGHG